MRILALETTDKTGTVAALDDCNILLELALDQNQRSAQSLAPAIETLLAQVDWSPKDVQLVGVSVGPGSFTGLRIGITAAKVFAYAVGAKVMGVNTLEAIALGACGTGWQPVPDNTTGYQPVLHTAINAQRGDVVAQSFSIHSPAEIESLGPQELLPVDKWLQRLKPGEFVSGPALTICHKLIAGSGATAGLSSSAGDTAGQASSGTPCSMSWLPEGVVALDRAVWDPKASAVGRLAARDYAAGRREDLWKLVPHYCRRSAAEEKWEAMGK